MPTKGSKNSMQIKLIGAPKKVTPSGIDIVPLSFSKTAQIVNGKLTKNSAEQYATTCL